MKVFCLLPGLLLLAPVLRAENPARAGPSVGDRSRRVDYSQIKTAQDRLKERLGGRINIRETDKMSVSDWRGVVSGLGPNEIALLQRRYPNFAADIREAAAPPEASSPERKPPGSAGAVSADVIRAAGGDPNTASRDGKDSPDKGAAGTDSDAETKSSGEEDESAAKTPAGPSKERQLEKGEVDRIGDKTRGLLQGKDELFGPKKESGDMPEAGARPERGRRSAQARPSPASPPGHASPPADPRAAAFEAIRRYQDSGAAPSRPKRISSDVPALTLASAAPSYGRAAPPPSGSSGFSAGPARPEPAKKVEKNVDTPFGKMTPEEEAELQSFLNMIDEVAATGVLDSESANKALIGAEAELGDDSALEKPLEDIRFILEQSGRKLSMSEQSYVLEAARRLGFDFNPKQAWNLLWALEKGTPPPPRIEKDRSFWQRFVRWLKRLLVRIIRLFEN